MFLMDKRRDNGLKKNPLLLLLLYVSYSVGVMIFAHTHHENGMTIWHSHPYSKKTQQEHSHSEQEFFILGRISNTTSEEVDLAYDFDLLGPEFSICFEIVDECILFSTAFCHPRLRAPPSF